MLRFTHVLDTPGMRLLCARQRRTQSWSRSSSGSLNRATLARSCMPTRSSQNLRPRRGGRLEKLDVDFSLVFLPTFNTKWNCATSRAWCTSTGKWQCTFVVMTCTLGRASHPLCQERTLRPVSRSVGNTPPPLPAWRGAILHDETDAHNGFPLHLRSGSTLENVVMTVRIGRFRPLVPGTQEHSSIMM
eukprot:3404163-Amphidinium_carterae.1